MPTTNRTYPRGSKWRKWDLQVHTPESIVNCFLGSSSTEKWERFLTDLEALPAEFKVLGINDYFFLDGYRRVCEEKRKGRLANIDCVFPVIELRLRDFCGTDSGLQKINMHVIFSDELGPDIIESQFLGSIRMGFCLDPSIAGDISWSAAPSPNSLVDLGRMIIDSAPPEKRGSYSDPLKVGFSALVYQLDTVRRRLGDTHYFDGKYVLAVGKTEWADIRWSDGAAAAKKDIINGADLVFVASESLAAYERARASLRAAHVNDRLMDCSDAHFNAASTEKDRIGNCFTWVKADPTFEGLKLTLKEFDARIEVSDEPRLLTQVRNNQTKFIDTVSFSKEPGSGLQENWMDGSVIRLNPGLVAIIGNKGSGKSALSDTIGLLGNTRQYKDFSFLSKTKFRDPKTGTKAENFVARMKWVSGAETPPKNLNTDPPQGASELVKYIPQDYLEKICNEVRRLEEGDFDRELKSVIFSHVDATEILGCKDLDSLIKYKTEASLTARAFLVKELCALNAEIVAFQEEASPKHRAQLEGSLKQKNVELEAHIKSKPPAMTEPKADPAAQARTAELTAQMASLQVELSQYDESIKQSQSALELANKRDAASQRLLDKIENFQRSFSSFIAECKVDAGLLGLTPEKLVQVQLDTTPVTELRERIRQEQKKRRRELDNDAPDSLIAKRTKTAGELKALQSQLTEPNRKYQAYLSSLKSWETAKAQILGDEQTTGSIAYLKRQLSDLDLIPGRLKEKEQARDLKVREIHRKIGELAESYRSMFSGVDEFVRKDPLASTLSISFKVDIVPMEFEERFLALINQKKAGTFCGADEGKERLNRLAAPVQFHEEEQVLKFLHDLLDALTHDRRSTNSEDSLLEDQLIKTVTPANLYNFIFSLDYLQPRYVLEWEGKDLSVLSPGERGTLLLAFYLLIDHSDIPLVIDQPEGNLDNETVYRVLVNCLKAAKKHRQVIIVTHNPNLAVVCDADQVIYSSIDRQDGNHITYASGSIEDPTMNRHVVDVLEGTKPAFRNRDDKYEVVTSAAGNGL